MNRRSFLKNTTLASLFATSAANRLMAQRPGAEPKAPPPPLAVVTPPVLQNASDTAVTVFWTTSAPATGWVEYGETPALGQVENGEVDGLLPYNDRVLRVRLTGLKPGRTYYYRVQTAALDFSHQVRVARSAAQAGPVYSFTTLNQKAAVARFIVWNDTHEAKDTLSKLIDHLPDHPADFLLWNGDMFKFVMSEDTLIQESLNPAGREFAANRPVIFCRGNHDARGNIARRMGRTLELPDGKYYQQFRQGPAACLLLDTGEDKVDSHGAYSGLVDFSRYRARQAAWLETAIMRPEFQSAPFRVLFTHIPLRGVPAGNDARQKWEALLKKGRVDFAISGHTHRHGYHEATAEQPWPLLVGGGPGPDNATYIHVEVTAERLQAQMFNLSGTRIGQWEIAPRGMPGA